MPSAETERAASDAREERMDRVAVLYGEITSGRGSSTRSLPSLRRLSHRLTVETASASSSAIRSPVYRRRRSRSICATSFRGGHLTFHGLQ